MLGETAQQRTSIWTELNAWCGSLRSWQARIVQLAVENGRLDDAQIDEVYLMFMEPNPESLGNSVIEARPDTPNLNAIKLEKVDGLSGVNALPDQSAMMFGSGLTIVYGRNGTGKSGFARVLAAACFCRHRPEILSNVNDEHAPESWKATFHLNADGQALEPLNHDSETVSHDLKRFAVFDSSAAQHHVSQSAPFEFKPVGFDVFSELVRVYSELSRRLDAAIAARSNRMEFAASFIGATTEVSAAASSITADTDLQRLQTLGAFGEVEQRRLAEVESDLLALRSNAPQERIATLTRSKQDVITLRDHLVRVATQFGEVERQRRNEIAEQATVTAATAATAGSDAFRKPFFNAVGSTEWTKFASAAHALARVESPSYPNADDRCLLCERTLDSDARSHIQALLAFVEGDSRRKAEEAQQTVEAEVTKLGQMSLPDFAASSRVRTVLQQTDTRIETEVGLLIEAVSAARRDAITALREHRTISTALDSGAVVTSLSGVVEAMDRDLMRLQAEDTASAISALDLERQTLRHRQVLSQLLPQIEKQLTDLRWVASAAAKKSGLNTRHITDKQTDLMARIVTADYRVRLAKECAALDCNLPITLQTQGRAGQTLRSLAMPKGYRPSQVLSEGEQKAVALADFLTETNLNPGSAGIILDDPVTSQDYDRKERIAARLVRESKVRQVIIFTHDLVFLNQLLVEADRTDADVVKHWIARDGSGRPGLISENDLPATSKAYLKTTRAKQALDKAKSAVGSERDDALRKGFGSLRTTLETAVVLSVFKNTVPRWNDQVRVTTLRTINWDNDKIDEICELYEELSRYIEGHTHSEEAARNPDMILLENKIAQVDALLSWARTARV